MKTYLVSAVSGEVVGEITIWHEQVARDCWAGHLEVPTQEELEDWMFDSVCEAACDCGATVEHDGQCEHGRPSWLLALGLI